MSFNCWKCEQPTTEEEVLDFDGFCPNCGADLDGSDGEE
jgi:Zn finger protein HypA/HybF involved in hydrogenase expression